VESFNRGSCFEQNLPPLLLLLLLLLLLQL